MISLDIPEPEGTIQVAACTKCDRLNLIINGRLDRVCCSPVYRTIKVYRYKNKDVGYD